MRSKLFEIHLSWRPDFVGLVFGLVKLIEVLQNEIISALVCILLCIKFAVFAAEQNCACIRQAETKLKPRSQRIDPMPQLNARRKTTHGTAGRRKPATSGAVVVKTRSTSRYENNHRAWASAHRGKWGQLTPWKNG